MRAVIILLILILSVSFAHAQVFDADAVLLSNNFDLTIKTLETGGTTQDVNLIRYNNPADPNVLYWRLGSLTPGLQTKTVLKKTFTYQNAEPLERHQLDVYYTDGSATNKVIMFVPGGAWRQGDKDLYATMGNTLAGFHDLTVAVINYRLSSEEGGKALHPDHIKDVATAFAWLKQNIGPYGDPNKMYLFGQSAGAHLASLLATDDTWLKAVGYDPSDILGVVSMSGAYYLPDLVAYPNNPLGLTADEALMFKKIMQDAFGGWEDADLTDPSPQMHIGSDQPPFLVIYTYNDLPGFALEAENFVKAVRALNPTPEISLRAIEFSDYTDDVWNTAKTQAANEPTMSEFVGHWAEVIAINPNEPDGYVTKLVVEFFQSH
jgi:acetyl esterase/lipase